LLQRSVSVEIDREWASLVQPVRTHLVTTYANQHP
jgi:hypothetical protein